MKYLRIFALLTCLLPGLLSARIYARWHTSMGSFTAELYNEIVPITAHNFRDLANSDFYNDLIFHRVIEGFVIQDGCPNGTGTGGPGYTIPDEYSPLLNHNEPGILSMARTSAPNSAGSQYFFTLAPQPHLNGNYAVFGKVIEGLEYVLGIGSVPTDVNDRPITPVNIYQVRMLDLTVGELYPAEDEVLELSGGQSQMFIVEAYTNEAELSFDWYVNDVLQSETSFIFETAFTQAGANNVKCHIASSDGIAYDANWDIQVSSSAADASSPELDFVKLAPNPFSDELSAKFELKEPGTLQVDVYNVKGQAIRQLYAGHKDTGTFSLIWDGKDYRGKPAAEGVYLLKVSHEQSNYYLKICKTGK